MLTVILILAAAGQGPIETPAVAPPTPLEQAAKIGVERALSFILEAPTVVEKVRLDSAKGVLELTNVRIANPKGFREGNAIEAQRVQVEADPKVLFSPEPVVRLIDVQGGAVNAEMTIEGKSNLKRILDSSKRFPPNPLLKNLPKKKWRIEKGVMDKGQVTLNSPLWGTPKKYALGKMEMSLLGRDGKGVTAQEAVARFLQVLLDRIAGVQSPAGPSTLLDALKPQ